MALYVAGLWRYPVKSLAGERLRSAAIDFEGVHGDRLVRVRGPEGMRTSRRHYRLLGLQGMLGPDGTPLISTDGAVAAFGRDVRRLRPNILIGGVVGLDEVHWSGAELHVGEVIIRLDSLRARCPMTTVDPDTLHRDPEVLRDIGRRFRGRLALNAEVGRGGTINVGDPVKLIRPVKMTR